MKQVSWFTEKGGSSGVTSKSEQKMNRDYSHTHIYVLLLFICWPELPSDVDFFGFALLTLEDVMWLRDTVLGKETLLKILIQVQAPKHIPCTLSPTHLSGTSAQKRTHLTALNVINAIALKTSRVKMQC